MLIASMWVPCDVMRCSLNLWLYGKCECDGWTEKVKQLWFTEYNSIQLHISVLTNLSGKLVLATEGFNQWIGKLCEFNRIIWNYHYHDEKKNFMVFDSSIWASRQSFSQGCILDFLLPNPLKWNIITHLNFHNSTSPSGNSIFPIFFLFSSGKSELAGWNQLKHAFTRQNYPPILSASHSTTTNIL